MRLKQSENGEKKKLNELEIQQFYGIDFASLMIYAPVIYIFFL